MKILYGVVGEGMGHATRSRVVISHLVSSGHEVRVVVSGRAHRFLQERFRGEPRVSVVEIHGLHLDYEGNAIDRSRSLWSNLAEAPVGVLRNIEAYGRVVESGFGPEMVISDFETWAYLYGLNHRLPVVSLDNQQVIARCQHDVEVTELEGPDYQLAKLAARVKIPGAYHYLVTSFFFPPVRKRRTTLVPPILRPEILSAKRERGSHVLVYQTAAANTGLVPLLRSLDAEFRVYGMGREGREGNVYLRAFSETGFVDDLRTARAVIAGGGFSLMGEAVHLGVPMLSVPLGKQYEQGLNAHYLEKLGYGMMAKELTQEGVSEFLRRAESCEAALHAGYRPHDNGMLFGCVDELVRDVEQDEPPPQSLRAPSMGTWDGPPIPEEEA